MVRGSARGPWLWSTLAALGIALALTALTFGPAGLPLGRVVAGLFGAGDPVSNDIVRQIRAPRVVLDLAVGAMLGLAGASLQGFLRNPLADPSVLGTSSTAALGAVLALYFGLAKEQPWALPVMAIAGALAGLALLLPLARAGEGSVTLVLAGVAVSAIGGAGVSLALNLAPNPFAVSEIAFWLLGSLSDRSWKHVVLAAPGMLLAVGLILSQRRALDALVLGEDAAGSLGFDLQRTSLLLALAVALGVGSAVAVAGAIGFVGLVAPHIVRPFTDGRPGRLLLPSALAGAVLLTAADLVVRLIPTVTELRLGVVTGFLGAPVFTAVLLRTRRLS